MLLLAPDDVAHEAVVARELAEALCRERVLDCEVSVETFVWNEAPAAVAGQSEQGNRPDRLRRKIAQQRANWTLLSEKLTGLEQDRILEVRSDEEMPLAASIKAAKTEQDGIEQP